MKTNIFLRITIIVAFTFIVNATMKGQATQTVLVGSTYHYTVAQSMGSGTSTFTWTNDATALQATNTPALGAGLTNDIQVNWLQTGTYHITVLETSSNGCPDPNAPKTITVTVQANTGTIAFATPLASNNCSGATATNLDLTLALGGTYTYPITVNYTVNTVAHTRVINSGTTISLGSEDNILNNTTTTNAPKTIVITSASCSGASITVGANNTYVYTANGTPATNGITTY